MFILEKYGVSFTFENKIGVIKKNGLYENEISGNVPVPFLDDSDRIILPIGEGIALDVCGEYENGETGYDFDNLNFRFASREGTVSMAVIQRNGKYLMIALKSGLNSAYSAVKENGRYRLNIFNEKPCRVFYGIFDSLISLCKKYKEVKAANRITLKEKAAENRAVNNLFGGAIFWVWNDNYDEVMYSDFNCEENPQTGEKLIDIAKDLKCSGVDRALFSIFFSADSIYTERLCKECVYITTQYDNYNDVLNPELLSIIPNNRVKNCDYTARRLKDYPDGLLTAADGTYESAWALKGFDGKMHSQNCLCPLVAKERMKEEVARITAEFPYYTGRFVDVYGINAAQKCFNENHPVKSFEECLEIKKQAFENLKGLGLITGTEDGFEDLSDVLVYSEGPHSPVCFRIKDAGRQHKNMYSASQEKHIAKHMLDPRCRVPLFELIYHENLLLFPYWGDSTDDSVSQINRKVLFALLFGCQPLYSFSVKNYEKLKPYIISSYRKTSQISRFTAAEPVSDYRILSDDYSLQQTVFGKKYSVTVNFSDMPQSVNGKIIPPQDFIFEVL